MSRELHEFGHVTRSRKPVPEVLTDAAHGAILVVAPDDDRLDTFLHRHSSGQTTLVGDDSLLPSSYDYQIGGLPESSDGSLPIETDAYDTLITLFSLSGYFQRGPPFMDFTRVVRSGGTILSATGLHPPKKPTTTSRPGCRTASASPSTNSSSPAPRRSRRRIS